MIHNYELARAINKERQNERHTHRSVASTETGELRRMIGRRLESLGRRLQGAPLPRQYGV